MSELQKTLRIAGVGLVLALLAFVTQPGQRTPDAFYDIGETFFPDFTDPNVATTLEVIDYDSLTGTALPFKVQFKDGKWTIPSHHEYPADGKDRLAETAAGVIGVTKDDFRTDNTADYEACGVIDPVDETVTALGGRGKRVTIKGKNDKVLADLIIGREVSNAQGHRFVRVPGEKRVYTSKIDLNISTTFNDWIEKDLLQVDQDKIDRVTIQDYSINERSGIVNQRDELILNKDESDWNANKMSGSQEVDKTKMTDLLKALDELSIVGVRPKPTGLTKTLSKMTGELNISQPDMLNLQSKGYYFARNGQLLSNEGEIQCETTEGVEYTLRFGEVVYGSGEEVSAGAANNANKDAGPGENRYLFITTTFNAKRFPEPKKPSNLEYQSKADSLWSNSDHNNKELQEAYEAWQKQVEEGSSLSDQLNNRFANWYYVISAESYDKLNLDRSTLVKKKEKEES